MYNDTPLPDTNYTNIIKTGEKRGGLRGSEKRKRVAPIKREHQPKYLAPLSQKHSCLISLTLLELERTC
jgi:hypothetical protein